MPNNKVSRKFEVPTNMGKSISKTSDAYECYVNRQFSGRLQAYLATYVVATTSHYSMFSGYTTPEDKK